MFKCCAEKAFLSKTDNITPNNFLEKDNILCKICNFLLSHALNRQTFATPRLFKREAETFLHQNEILG